MPGDYDEMSERSHINYAGGTPEPRRLRDLLRAAMDGRGLRRLRTRMVTLRLQGLAAVSDSQS